MAAKNPEERLDRLEQVVQVIAEDQLSLQKLISELATETRRGFDRVAQQFEETDKRFRQTDERIDRQAQESKERARYFDERVDKLVIAIGGVYPPAVFTVGAQELAALAAAMNIAELREQADAGSCVNQTVLGICYLYGIDTAIDYQEAFQLLSAAAEQGASRARANLALMYSEGLCIPQDLSKAMTLYRQAADAGEFFAQIELGRIYASGLLVPSDPDEARKWYSAAVAQAERWVGDCDAPQNRIVGFDRSLLNEAKDYLASAPGS